MRCCIYSVKDAQRVCEDTQDYVRRAPSKKPEPNMPIKVENISYFFVFERSFTAYILAAGNYRWNPGFYRLLATP